MRAVVTNAYGSPPTVTELEAPTPHPHEVRVEVRASSLNGFDVALANGYLKGLMEHRFPVVLGRDFAGVVDQVGDGVSRFRVGDVVFGVVLTQPLHAGAFADYLVVPEDHNIAACPPDSTWPPPVSSVSRAPRPLRRSTPSPRKPARPCWCPGRPVG